MSITISLSAMVCLIILFSPKLYILLLHPEKNIRAGLTTTAKYKKSATSNGRAPSKEVVVNGNGAGHGHETVSDGTQTSGLHHRTSYSTTATQTGGSLCGSLYAKVTQCWRSCFY